MVSRGVDRRTVLDRRDMTTHIVICLIYTHIIYELISIIYTVPLNTVRDPLNATHCVGVSGVNLIYRGRKGIPMEQSL